MSKRIIKIFSLVISIIMVSTFILTGCGEKKQEDLQNTSSATQAETSKEEVKKEPVTITYTSFRYEDEAIFKELVGKFEKENGLIKVNLDLQKDANVYLTNLKANLLSGEGVDVFDVHPNYAEFVSNVQEGNCVDLSNESFVKNYYDGFKDLTTIDGKVYAYVYSANFLSAIYNKDIFAKYGLNPPKSFDEFKSTIAKLKENDLGGIIIPFGTGWIGQSLMWEQMTPEGGKKFQEGIDNGSITNVRDNKDFYTLLKTLSEYNKLKYPDSETIQYPQVLSLFAQQKAPIIMMGTWTFGTKATDYPGINQGFFALPTLDKVDVAHLEPGGLSAISSKSKNIEAAKKWLEFFSNTENAQMYINKTKMIPTLKGVKMEYEGADMLQAQLDKGIAVTPILVLNNVDIWGKQWGAMMDNIFVKGQDVEKEIDDFNAFLASAKLKDKK